MQHAADFKAKLNPDVEVEKIACAMHYAANFERLAVDNVDNQIPVKSGDPYPVPNLRAQAGGTWKGDQSSTVLKNFISKAGGPFPDCLSRCSLRFQQDRFALVARGAVASGSARFPRRHRPVFCGQLQKKLLTVFLRHPAQTPLLGKPT